LHWTGLRCNPVVHYETPAINGLYLGIGSISGRKICEQQIGMGEVVT